MSNVAGKAYAMNVITPIRWYTAWLNKLIFWVALKVPSTLKGLITLSLIHYARWVIIGPKQFPHLSPQQPKEELKYAYMLFFSNFNGSWDQYVDSFSFAIPAGLDMFWKWNVRYPRSIALTPFHQYIRFNQIETIHYYNAYPLATSNDVKSAHAVRNALLAFQQAEDVSDEAFMTRYKALLRSLQHDLGDMAPTPIVSMSAYQVERRERWHASLPEERKEARHAG
ncbi:MAG TPA: hypothetical protein VLA61_09660 [Ideonella sp.]|uniref:hypothetical protein n=1 Tax=Ideonella sp. TaxID=1929293 RepID=UPI002C4E653B|nr:hypothetical protein [Ideonella sp.]HSI48524.1 hypothetical protein [Ideonella sp.]